MLAISRGSCILESFSTNRSGVTVVVPAVTVSTLIALPLLCPLPVRRALPDAALSLALLLHLAGTGGRRVRALALGGQGDDEATAGETAGVTEEPDADAADALFAVAVPDR